MMSYFCLTAVEAQGMLHPNMPQWYTDDFVLKLLEKQSVEKKKPTVPPTPYFLRVGSKSPI